MNQTTYIFNNAQELKQQEQNLQNISKNMPPRQTFGKAGAKLAKLNQKYETGDLNLIQINKVNSDHDLLSKQPTYDLNLSAADSKRDTVNSEHNTFQFSNLKGASDFKVLKVFSNKYSHSVTVDKRNHSKQSSKQDLTAGPGPAFHKMSYEAQMPYSVYDQPLVASSYKNSKVHSGRPNHEYSVDQFRNQQSVVSSGMKRSYKQGDDDPFSSNFKLAKLQQQPYLNAHKTTKSQKSKDSAQRQAAAQPLRSVQEPATGSGKFLKQPH